MLSLHSVLVQYINKIRYFQNLVLFIVNKKHTHYFYLNKFVAISRVYSKILGILCLLHFCDGLVLEALPDGAFSQQSIFQFYLIYKQIKKIW